MTDDAKDKDNDQQQGDAVKDSSSTDLKRLQSELSGVHQQAGEWKKRFESVQKELDKINAERQKAAEEKAKQAGEHEKIIAEREKKIAELESALQARERDYLIADASSRLAGAVKSALARKAIAAEWAAKTAEQRYVGGALEAFVESK